MNASPATIDEVIERLTGIVDDTKAQHSRAGYFAALYRKVTIEVADRIRTGFFEDGERMERLDVMFAQRYLDAFDAVERGERTTESWQVAFETTQQWWPIVLRHLLLGMNAHINLDLGIAAARSVPPEELPDLKADFFRINAVFASMLEGVQDDLAELWTTFRLLDWALGDIDEAIANFSMERARDHAWAAAEQLAPLDDVEQARAIERLDQQTARFARRIRAPGLVGRVAAGVIRLGERGSVPEVIEVLS